MYDFDSRTPIYLQVVEQITLKILSGQLQPGDKIDSVREMASTLGVNPNTIQRALLELEHQGLIVTQRAVGRFVSSNQELIEDLRQKKIRNLMKEFVTQMRVFGVCQEDILKYLKEDIYE